MAAALYARCVEAGRHIENPVAAILFHAIFGQSDRQFAYDAARPERRFQSAHGKTITNGHYSAQSAAGVHRDCQS